MPSALTYYAPHLITVVFLVVFFRASHPTKARFFIRALLALLLALFLAHLNRNFKLWPSHLFFASGHMTYWLGVAFSLGMLQPLSLFVTLPLGVLLGIGLVTQGFHTTLDVLGAVVIIAIVYGLIHRFWPLPQDRNTCMTIND